MTRAKSEILLKIDASAKRLHAAGLMDQVTMREFEEMCLQPVEPLPSGNIKQIREAANVSQAVFARYLNTSLSSVQKWETGQKRPGGTALKLLHIVRKRGLDAVV